MKALFFTLLLLLPPGAEAAKAKKKEAKLDPHKMSEAELRKAAESELRISTPSGKVVPLEAPESGMVSTEELVREAEKEPLATSEVEVGAQSFRPVGSGRISSAETYSYDGLSTKPMVLFGGRHWFLQRLRTSAPYRAGLSLQGGVSSHSMRIKTNRGYVYDDVRLNTLVGLVGPEAEYFLDGRRRFALGLRLGAGRLLSSQSAAASTINQSRSLGIWEGSAHLRFQPTRNFYLTTAYARRSNLGSAEGLGVQENNYQAFIGFGM